MLYFIVNPNSGGEKGFKVWKKLERRLEKQKAEYRAFITDGPGDAARIAAMLTKNASEPMTLVALGGDGTFSEMLNGIHISDLVTAAYLPTGSGNDLARGLKLSRKQSRNLARILHPQNAARMDYGVISYGQDEIVNRRFAVSSGIGYDAQVCRTLGGSGIRRYLSVLGLQKIAYTIEGVRTLWHTKPSKGYLVLDGRERVEFNHILFVSAHIHGTEGGGYRFAPKADPEDGKLTVCVVHTNSRLHFIRILLSAKAGNHLKYKGVRSYDCRSVRIHVERPTVIHADGETFPPQTDVEMHCIERKIRVIR